MRKVLTGLSMLLCIFFGRAMGECLLLPSSLEIIEAEAFSNNTGIRSVILPDTAVQIQDSAFSGCSNLKEIVIPPSVTEIASDAFDNCQQTLLIRTSADSTAMLYAILHQLDFNAETKYRALLIGQEAYTTSTHLPGTQNDIQIMQHVLGQYGYQVSTRSDLTAEDIQNAINTSLGSSQSQDVSLLYYAGHGIFSEDADHLGALCGIDGSIITGATLKTWMDRIPGRKILIIDACYSGNLIGRSANGSSAEAFISSLMRPFTLRNRSGELAADSYYVITAARSTQESYEITDPSGCSYGVFTYCFGCACGYDFQTKSYCEQSADLNHDRVITLQEAYQIARLNASSLCSSQTAQVYPSNCNWFGIFRKPEGESP